MAKTYHGAATFLDPMEQPTSIGNNRKRESDHCSLIGPEVERTGNSDPILEQATKSDLDIDRVSGETRNQKAMKVCEPTKEKWIDDEKKSFNE